MDTKLRFAMTDIKVESVLTDFCPELLTPNLDERNFLHYLMLIVGQDINIEVKIRAL